MIDVLLIGHSHTQCIIRAMQARGVAVGWGFVGVPSGGSPLEVTAEGECRLQPAVSAGLRGQIAPGTLCISTIAGNAHNVLSLMATDPPFDFRTPDDPAPPRAGAVPIPYQAVRLSLETSLRDGDLAMLYATRAAVPEMRFHIESPPPLADDTLVRARMDPYFLQTYPDAQVADASLRLKMWRLHSALFAQACKALDVTFVSAPLDAIDSDGFLRPDYAHPTSSTHANEAYGALVADQIERLGR